MSFQYETETFLASEARFTFVSHFDLCNICNKNIDSVVKSFFSITKGQFFLKGPMVSPKKRTNEFVFFS